MPARPTYVILGGGLTGHSAALTLHHGGFDGRIVLIGDEPLPPYDRPPLSKAYLQGKKAADTLPFQAVEQYRQQGIELLLGRQATGVDFASRTLRLEGGDALAYDKLLIATGAAPVRLRQPGFELAGVRYLRSLADADALREQLAGSERALVIGAGFIGCEVAASLRGLGRAVTLVDLLSCPMEMALGAPIGQLYAQLHRRHGVDLRLNRRVTELRGNARVEEALLDDGSRVACDLVVIGVGVRAMVDLFQETDLALDDGVLVDEYCRTNLPDVYAAGDVAAWWHPTLQRRMRVQHFDNAGLQGKAAALSMLGQPEPYAPVPYFWSDQYDVNLQFVGDCHVWDQLILRGDPEQPAVTAFYLNQGVVDAAVTVNQPRELRSVRRIVEAHVALDPAVLADPATDLRTLSRSLVAG